MIYVVLAFLAISLLLYVLLAGADFGAGIIELFSSKENH
ncbi:MAG TPA: cytochrome BD ubiquinol oxidase subunit II, partial [Maribacter sp.]|nr:cytochrome BD ubiquinol oxidase subunit II [Maribacter sp.]